MTRTTTRRETNRLRAEIMEGIAEYREEQDRAARLRRCGTLTESIPAGWLRLFTQPVAHPFRACPGTGLFGPRRPQPFYLN